MQTRPCSISALHWLKGTGADLGSNDGSVDREKGAWLRLGNPRNLAVAGAVGHQALIAEADEFAGRARAPVGDVRPRTGQTVCIFCEKISGRLRCALAVLLRIG